MCATIKVATAGDDALKGLFNLAGAVPMHISRVIYPGQNALAVRETASGRTLDELRWGLVPAWATDEEVGKHTFNARAETLGEKPSFRAAYRSRRCLIVATSYFEWTGERGSKKPWEFGLKSGEPFAIAGLWERWEGGAEPLESCTVITTSPNELAAQVHNRMPAIILRSDHEAWLSHEASAGDLAALLAPLPADLLTGAEVTRAAFEV